MPEAVSYWVVIPAAGFGERMQFDKPKQYIEINNKTIIEHTLEHFISRDDIKGIIVAIAREDSCWSALKVAEDHRISTITGGADRYQSVLNSLRALSEKAEENDWVIVHDAARPCLSRTMIDRLIKRVGDHDVGGILALRCRDTMKQVDDKRRIERTVERDRLWHAQTPQMFRYEKLFKALSKALEEQHTVTDEAMAMELSGYQPLVIEGPPDNIKLTYQEDIGIIRACLSRVQEG